MASKRTKWVLIVSLLVLVIGGLYAAAFTLGGTFGGAGIAGDYEEEFVTEGDSDQKVALINVVGEIFSDPDGFAEGASDTNIIRQLDQAIDDTNVVAVILNLETPGGGVVASDAIYRRALEVSAQGKPVVALMGDVAASGGYYIAAGAKEIVAHPATMTGSIGVIAFLPNFEKAAEKLGVAVTVLKSGAFKDAGSPFRTMTEDEKNLFQILIDESYEQFVQAVAKGRSLDPSRVRELADGRVYSGLQAKGLGLVDHLGDRNTAFGRAKNLARAPNASLVRYSTTQGFSDFLGVASKFFDRNALAGVKEEFGLRRHPGVAYLWLP